MFSFNFTKLFSNHKSIIFFFYKDNVGITNLIWNQILKYQGEFFKTKKGKIFSYRVENETIITQWHFQNEKRKHMVMHNNGFRLKKHHIQKSIPRIPIQNVIDLRDIFLYPSHLWGILHDPRILSIDDHDFLKKIISSFYETNEHEKVIAICDIVLKKSPKNSFYFIAKANSYDIIGKSLFAIKLYDKVLKMEPDNSDALFNKAVTFDKLGDSKKAIQFYDETLIIKPDFYYANYFKAILLNKLGKKLDALTVLYELDNKDIPLALVEKISNLIQKIKNS